MNRRSFLIGGGSLAALAAGGYFALRPFEGPSMPIVLGWQPPWANQGQLVEVLKGYSAGGMTKPHIEFMPFTFGGPMAEAALAGRLDVIFLGDHPALKLISKDPSWKIVSRLTNYRSAFLVSPDSPLDDILDLKGKTIGTAIGSTTHRDAARVLSKNGITPEDVIIVNIDQAEHSSVIGTGATSGRWGQFDAIATYDPTVALAVAKGQARVLYQWASLGVVAASREMLTTRRAELALFLTWLRRAYVDYAKQPDLYDQRYLAGAGINMDPTILRQLTKVEPCLGAKDIGSVSLELSSVEFQTLKENVESAKRLNLLPLEFNEKTAMDFLAIDK